MLTNGLNLLVLNDERSFGDLKATFDKEDENVGFKIFQQIHENFPIMEGAIKFGDLSGETNDLIPVVLGNSPDPGLQDVCCLKPSRFHV
jgi:hypothetical protein